jgi:tetratricopeptide (TPR) repeat protein
MVLGIPAALLHLDTLERLADTRIIRLKPAMLKSLEDGIRSRWHMYYHASNHVTEEGLLEQIEILEQLADNNEGDTKRIARVLSQSYQLAGTLARDDFKYSRAKKYFRDAFHFAKDAQSPDLTSISVARHAVVLLRQERVDDALLLYNEAIHLAKNAQALVQSYIYSGLAEALARKGQPDECYRLLDLSEKLFNKGGNDSFEDDLAFVRLTIQSLQDTRGECYVLSGQPRKGIEYLEKAEKGLDRTFSRNYCRLLLQQSEAFLAAGEVDICVERAIEGLEIANTLGSAGNINWASEIHDKLLISHWKNEPVVGKLGAAIVSK